MRTLITIACLLGAAMGQYWGHGHGGVHDTPEVEAAKAAHFAAHAKAVARLGHGHGWEGDHTSSWASQQHVDHHAPHYEEHHKKWTGPIALPPGYDKHGAPLPVHDTHEVAAEKARHFSLYSHGAYAGAYAAHGGHGEWSSPAHHSDWTPTSGPWGY